MITLVLFAFRTSSSVPKLFQSLVNLCFNIMLYLMVLWFLRNILTPTTEELLACWGKLEIYGGGVDLAFRKGIYIYICYM